jgi:hypothetical protein
VKKFLLVLVALGVTAAIAYLLFARARKTSDGAEREIDLREMASDEVADSAAQIAETVGSTGGAAN